VSWLTLISALVSGISTLVDFLGQRQLLKAGAAGAIKESLEEVLYNVDQADRAERGLYLDPQWVERVSRKYERGD
jgi:hypothetical protein